MALFGQKAPHRAAAANHVILGEMPVSCLGAEFAVEFNRAEVKHSGVCGTCRGVEMTNSTNQ